MVVGVFWEGAFVLNWLAPLLLWALSPLVPFLLSLLLLLSGASPRSFFVLAATSSTLRRASSEYSSFRNLLAFL